MSRFACSRHADSLRLGLVSGPLCGPALALALLHPRCSRRLSASLLPRFHSRLLLKGRDVARRRAHSPPRSRLHFTWSSPRPCFQPVTAPLCWLSPTLLPAFIAIFCCHCFNILSRGRKRVKKNNRAWSTKNAAQKKKALTTGKCAAII